MPSIFESHESFDKNAILNWQINGLEPIQNFMIIADGYISSSSIMIETCLVNNDDQKADRLIFPIIANLNHGIELNLKAIQWSLNTLLKTNSRFDGGHNLEQHFNVCLSLAYRFDPKFKDHFVSSHEVLDEYIQDIFSKIGEDKKGNPNLDFARYPIRRDYADHFYSEELNNIDVNLINLKELIDVIHEELRKTIDFLYFERVKKM